MIIYSVTVTIETSMEQDWTDWMQSIHIPDVMATGYFSASHFQRLLEPAPEAGLSTFNIQYNCASMEDLEAYQAKEAPRLQADHTERYKDRFVAFRTILQREGSF